ncbi:hypothetical protein [Bradyrhizobium iriomotense]|uniref:hypothetical protein n=1 Tax=Bradyrhizobium iriomotense TaxID=441950 RepID=UPI001B89EB44|nr:hypothetical protein [Bradyrhizobium iriomotense]MBR1127381.1 hypothetical protein [Bradyrhizobium iriomotense]
MTQPNDFFTTESLLTFGGATLATFFVPNALQAALQWNPRWLGLAVAEFICFAVVGNAWWLGAATSPFQVVVAFINGCLVYCSAMGITSIGADATGVSGAKGTPLPKDDGEKAERSFLTPWV